MKTQQFINRYRVRMTADLVDENPNIVASDWAAGATHWKCLLKCGRHEMTVFFSQGPAISSEPEAKDVLSCLASDAAGVAQAGDFSAWCNELGYSDDSRKAERIYKLVERQASKLEQLLGRDAYEELLYKVEAE